MFVWLFLFTTVLEFDFGCVFILGGAHRQAHLLTAAKLAKPPPQYGATLPLTPRRHTTIISHRCVLAQAASLLRFHLLPPRSRSGGNDH